MGVPAERPDVAETVDQRDQGVRDHDGEADALGIRAPDADDAGQDADDANLINIYEGKQTMSVYKNLANEVAITLAVAKAALEGEIDGQALVDSFDIDVAFDMESYETTPGNKCPSFLLVPTVVTKDNMQVLVDTGLYAWNADNTYVQKVK